MSKIKILFFLILAFVFYKGVVAFKNFEIGVDDRVAEIEELADFEKEGEVIGLMMYLGDPPELKEHFFTESRSKCLELKGGFIFSKNMCLLFLDTFMSGTGAQRNAIATDIIRYASSNTDLSSFFVKVS